MYKIRDCYQEKNTEVDITKESRNVLEPFRVTKQTKNPLVTRKWQGGF
jgi:hypothetical protein